jgi:hypothetical protein
MPAPTRLSCRRGGGGTGLYAVVNRALCKAATANVSIHANVVVIFEFLVSFHNLKRPLNKTLLLP